jgi:uncharacterized protein YbjQ (UPF0145 family)
MADVLVSCHLCEASVATNTRRPDEELRAAGWVVRLGVTYCPNCATAEGIVEVVGPAVGAGDEPLAMSTGAEIPGRVLGEGLGVCFGVFVRGGSADSEVSRRRALERLGANARLLGADGVISVRFDSSDSEAVAYGTAVRFAS